MSIVVCKLPKAGLGNQLFPIMHAYLFAKLNGLPVVVTGYHQIKIGAYLRSEKSKRKYRGYFIFQKGVFGEYRDRLIIKRFRKKYTTVYEPRVAKLSRDELDNCVFVFEKMTHYTDYFINLKNYRSEVIEILNSILQPKLVAQIQHGISPIIGVHIRMGDFRKLNKDEIYNGGHVRMPETFYVDTINSIRRLNGKNLEVSVFTDGYQYEFHELFKLKNIKLVEENPDIVDLFLLSKSRILIPAHGSTFSAWAAFLSESPVLHYFDNLTSMRGESNSSKYYECILKGNKVALIDYIKNIHE